MTAVLPEEVPDERLRAVPAAAITHKRMLKLPADPPDVEHPHPALHPLQVARCAGHAVAEQEVRWGRVAVQPALPVLAPLRAVPPPVAQPAKLSDAPLSDPVGLCEPAGDRVEVPALGIEIHRCPVRRPVVQG